VKLILLQKRVWTENSTASKRPGMWRHTTAPLAPPPISGVAAFTDPCPITTESIKSFCASADLRCWMLFEGTPLKNVISESDKVIRILKMYLCTIVTCSNSNVRSNSDSNVQHISNMFILNSFSHSLAITLLTKATNWHSLRHRKAYYCNSRLLQKVMELVTKIKPIILISDYYYRKSWHL
jgi:hypothetical protein